MHFINNVCPDMPYVTFDKTMQKKNYSAVNNNNIKSTILHKDEKQKTHQNKIVYSGCCFLVSYCYNNNGKLLTKITNMENTF